MRSDVTDWGKRASRAPGKLDVNAAPSFADILMFSIFLVFSALCFFAFLGLYGCFRYF